MFMHPVTGRAWGEVREDSEPEPQTDELGDRPWQGRRGLHIPGRLRQEGVEQQQDERKGYPLGISSQSHKATQSELRDGLHYAGKGAVMAPLPGSTGAFQGLLAEMGVYSAAPDFGQTLLSSSKEPILGGRIQ